MRRGTAHRVDGSASPGLDPGFAQRVLEGASVSVCWSKSDGSIIYVNERACRTTGFTRDELLRMSVRDLVPAFSESAFSARWQELCETGNLDLELVYRSKDGSLHPVEGRISLVASGGERYSCALLMDITGKRQVALERQLLAEALRSREAQLRGLFEGTTEGIFQLEPRGRITLANPSMARILGYSSAQEFMDSLEDARSGFFIPGHADRLVELIRRDSQVIDFETQLWRKDGSVVWVVINARAVRNPQGEVIHVDGTLMDLSERKRVETDLYRVQRLDSLGRLVGGVVHDLRNILSPLLLVPRLLRGNLSDPEELKLLDGFEANIHRGVDMLNQLLTFCRGTEGLLRRLSLADLVKGMLPVLKPALPKDIDLQISLPEGLPPILGDPTQLEQVIMNLCVNARDAMPDGGELNLTLEPVEVDELLAALNPAAAPGPYLVLRISDTGTGIHPEHLANIFNPFFTTKAIGQGTGLGLSTVLGIVKSHRGIIQSDSVLGCGSRFSVYLPLAEEKPVE